MPVGVLGVEDGRGVWPLLFAASGYAALERGSDEIELIDLLKAIYVVDLEHVTRFWSDWEDFEAFVSNLPDGDGQSSGYINRTLFLIRLDVACRQSETPTLLAKVSRDLRQVVDAARELRAQQPGISDTPTSAELLYCICSADTRLSEALQISGLNFSKLKATINKRL